MLLGLDEIAMSGDDSRCREGIMAVIGYHNKDPDDSRR